MRTLMNSMPNESGGGIDGKTAENDEAAENEAENNGEKGEGYMS